MSLEQDPDPQKKVKIQGDQSLKEHQNDLKINQYLKEKNVDFTNIVKMIAIENDVMTIEPMHGNLTEYIAKYKPDENEWILIIKQILNGLSVLRSHKYFYGNIRPENILYKIEGQQSIFKITNFRLTKRHQYQGTPAYMSPEFYNNLNEVKEDMMYLGYLINELCIDDQNNFKQSQKLENIVNQLQQGITPNINKNLKNNNQIEEKQQIGEVKQNEQIIGSHENSIMRDQIFNQEVEQQNEKMSNKSNQYPDEINQYTSNSSEYPVEKDQIYDQCIENQNEEKNTSIKRNDNQEEKYEDSYQTPNIRQKTYDSLQNCINLGQYYNKIDSQSVMDMILNFGEYNKFLNEADFKNKSA